MTENDLLMMTEEAVDEAVREIVEGSPQLKRPISGWDGARRIWILRDHEPEDHLYREVIAALVTLPTTTFDTGVFKLEISARAWSSWYRKTPLEAPVFSVVVAEKHDVPTVKVLFNRLSRGLDMAREWVDHIEEESSRLEDVISKVTKYI
ncbi:hypothetical protein [Streptomyces acidiscabies]|uniref:hypothetical protein n=1 Tax=Streptomyces acidiscabies TaxID=42234 RepID=UPI00118012E6|nr:hypothetical protein [Streptomyces acidiscabies]